MESRHREWWNSVVTGVLLMVSRVRASEKAVILIGATNYIDRIDGALKRPGRIGRHILVRPPETEEEVAELIKFYAGNDLGGADIAYAAKLAGNTTPAAVEAWMRSARRAAREAERAVVIDDLVAQIAPVDTRSEKALNSCALHEAAHAVAALELGFELKSVSVIAEGDAGGRTLSRGKANTPTLADVEDRVVMTLAGRAADRLLSGDADIGSTSDLEIATRVLVAARTSHGLRDSLVYRADEASFETLLRIDPVLLRQVDDDLTRLMQRTVAQGRRLELARADLERIRTGWRPLPDDLRTAPILDYWILHRLDSPLAWFEGIVSGHPEIADGHHAITSAVIALDLSLTWVRTVSRFYRLGLRLGPDPRG